MGRKTENCGNPREVIVFLFSIFLSRLKDSCAILATFWRFLRVEINPYKAFSAEFRKIQSKFFRNHFLHKLYLKLNNGSRSFSLIHLLNKLGKKKRETHEVPKKKKKKKKKPLKVKKKKKKKKKK